MVDKNLFHAATDMLEYRYPSIEVPLIDFSNSNFVLSSMLDGLVKGLGDIKFSEAYFGRVTRRDSNATDERCRILLDVLEKQRPISPPPSAV